MRLFLVTILLTSLVYVGFARLAEKSKVKVAQANPVLVKSTKRQKERCKPFDRYPDTIVCSPSGDMYHLQPGGKAYMGNKDQLTPLSIPAAP